MCGPLSTTVPGNEQTNRAHDLRLQLHGQDTAGRVLVSTLASIVRFIAVVYEIHLDKLGVSTIHPQGTGSRSQSA